MDLGTRKPGASSVTMGTIVRNRAPELSNARDLLTGRPIRRYTTAAAAAAAFNFFGAVFWVRAAALVSMETSEGRTRTAKATGHSLAHSPVSVAAAENGCSTDVKAVGWYGGPTSDLFGSADRLSHVQALWAPLMHKLTLTIEESERAVTFTN